MRVALFVGFLLAVGVGHAETEHRAHLPLGRNVDLELLDQALKVPGDKLVEFIEAQGVKVYSVPSQKTRNPALAHVAKVSKGLAAESAFKVVFEDSGTGTPLAEIGLFIPNDDSDLGRFGPCIVISEAASSYTLLHEFTHFLFYATELPRDRTFRASLADRSFAAMRTFDRQFQFSFVDLAVSDRYKRDHLIENLVDLTRTEAERVHYFVAEEVLIEGILAQKVDRSSPHFNPERTVRGIRYARSKIQESRIELARKALMYTEVSYWFMRVAGHYPGTSIAEREEIITSIPEYRAAVFGVIDPVSSTLDQLALFIPNSR